MNISPSIFVKTSMNDGGSSDMRRKYELARLNQCKISLLVPV